MSGAGSSGERRRDQGRDGGVLRAPPGSPFRETTGFPKMGWGFWIDWNFLGRTPPHVPEPATLEVAEQ